MCFFGANFGLKKTANLAYFIFSFLARVRFHCCSAQAGVSTTCISNCFEKFKPKVATLSFFLHKIKNKSKIRNILTQNEEILKSNLVRLPLSFIFVLNFCLRVMVSLLSFFSHKKFRKMSCLFFFPMIY